MLHFKYNSSWSIRSYQQQQQIHTTKQKIKQKYDLINNIWAILLGDQMEKVCAPRNTYNFFSRLIYCNEFMINPKICLTNTVLNTAALFQDYYQSMKCSYFRDVNIMRIETDWMKGAIYVASHFSAIAFVGCCFFFAALVWIDIIVCVSNVGYYLVFQLEHLEPPIYLVSIVVLHWCHAFQFVNDKATTGHRYNKNNNKVIRSRDK